MRDYYTRYPRPILWLVPGGPVEPFYLSKLPVTNEQYEAFDPDHERDPRWPGNHDPVTSVSGAEAIAYCHWYAEVARKPIRLPTEAEWDHACRAGATGRFYFDEAESVDEYVADREATGERLLPLEDFRPNPHGLYGMLGGVWEWVAAPDGSIGEGIQRGGSFRTPRADTSCGLRRAAAPDTRARDVGFRIAKSLRTP